LDRLNVLVIDKKNVRIKKGGVIMSNEGKRTHCLCIQEMTMLIGKQEIVLFAFKKVYSCMIRTSDTEANYYKIYGEEFALSCSETEFKEHFRLVHHHSKSKN